MDDIGFEDGKSSLVTVIAIVLMFSMTSWYHCCYCLKYLIFLCSRTADEALRISKANFDSYLIVGLTEEFESFIQLVGKFLPGLYGGLEGLYREEVDSKYLWRKKPDIKRLTQYFKLRDY